MTDWSLGRIVRRLLLYFGIALASLAATALIVFLSVRTRIEIPSRWVGFTMFTSLLLWALIRSYRDYWIHPQWWLVLASLMALHLLVFVPLLRSYPKWPVLWFGAVVVVEAGIFSTILDVLFTWSKKRARH